MYVLFSVFKYMGLMRRNGSVPRVTLSASPVPPAVLGSEGASAGEAAADAAGVDSDALSSAPEVRPAAASDMPQAH